MSGKPRQRQQRQQRPPHLHVHKVRRDGFTEGVGGAGVGEDAAAVQVKHLRAACNGAAGTPQKQHAVKGWRTQVGVCGNGRTGT